MWAFALATVLARDRELKAIVVDEIAKGHINTPSVPFVHFTLHFWTKLTFNHVTASPFTESKFTYS